MPENGAVLRAKHKGVDLDSLSEKYDEESIDMLSDRYEKMMNASDRRTSDGYNSDVRSTISSSSRAERRALHERTVLSREENWDVEVEVDAMRGRSSHEKMNQDLMMRRPGRVRDGRIGEKKKMHTKEGSSYDFEDPTWNRNDVDGSDRVGDDRAELLRQLDELKQKLRVSDKEKAPFDRIMSPYASEHHLMIQNSFNRPPLQNQYPEPPPLMSRHEMRETGFYHSPSHVQGYMNPSRSQRGYLEAQASFQMSSARVYSSGPIMDKHMPYVDNMEVYTPSIIRHHHPSCSCYQCRTAPPDDMVSSYGDYNRRAPDPPPLRSVQSHARRPHVTAGVKVKHFCPIAGGAPFLTCNICSELLLLPKKAGNAKGSKKKIKCGACSSVIHFAGKGFVVSSEVDAKISTVNVASSQTSQTRANFTSCEDYDDSGYDFHSMDRELDNKATKTRNRPSYASEEESVAVEETGLADDAREDKGPTLQDYFEQSNQFKMAQKSEAGNKSGRSEHDIKKMSPNMKEFVRKDSAATEIDVSSSNEFFNTGSTFESGEGTRGSRRGGSFVAGIMGTLNESHRSEEESLNGSVTVNGHLISDRLVKKAERLAGPIQPGHYWYDFRAGFWGAMGSPCLGIIPPFIQEFNFPMQENCAGGNTHILVNGRELNHKDLNLLGSRGLPRERDRSYIVEISGRVLDDETGEELESLGKLAPTMERAKRGFGMRVPQAVV